MSNRHISVALRLGEEFRGSCFSCLPILDLDRILDNLFLAVHTVAAILLVRFLEAIEPILSGVRADTEGPAGRSSVLFRCSDLRGSPGPAERSGRRPISARFWHMSYASPLAHQEATMTSGLLAVICDGACAAWSAHEDGSDGPGPFDFPQGRLHAPNLLNSNPEQPKRREIVGGRAAVGPRQGFR